MEIERESRKRESTSRRHADFLRKTVVTSGFRSFPQPPARQSNYTIVPSAFVSTQSTKYY